MAAFLAAEVSLIAEKKWDNRVDVLLRGGVPCNDQRTLFIVCAWKAEKVVHHLIVTNLMLSHSKLAQICCTFIEIYYPPRCCIGPQE